EPAVGVGRGRGHRHRRRPETVPAHGRQFQPDRLGAQPRQPGAYRLDIGAGVEQRGDEHVTGRAVGRVYPQCLHRTPRRAIRAAATPAPNPLSTFTVSTPGAQLLRTASHAVNPSRCQPYPTLVGTAIRGAPVSPPSTDGNAASI